MSSDACTPDENAAQWARTMNAPYALPNRAADLNLVGADGKGLTLEEVAAIVCTHLEPKGVCLIDSCYDYVDFSSTTHRIVALTMTEAVSEIETTSEDGAHSYSIGLGPGGRLKKDGAPFDLPVGWMADPTFSTAVDELYRSLIHTFLPLTTLPPAGETCLADKTCIAQAPGGGDVANVVIPALGFTFWVDNRNGAQPLPSTPTRFDFTFVP